MKKRTRRMIALVVVAVFGILPVSVSAVFVLNSRSGRLAQSIAADLEQRLVMKVTIERAETLSPAPFRVLVEGITVTPLGSREPALGIEEAVFTMGWPQPGYASIELTGASASLGDADSQRELLAVLGRIMYGSRITQLDVRMAENATELSIMLDAGKLFTVVKLDEVVVSSNEPGATVLEFKGSLRDGESRLSTAEGQCRVAGGRLSYQIALRRADEQLFRDTLARVLGEPFGRAVERFDGSQVLTITDTGRTETFTSRELTVNLSHLYEEMGVRDTFNALEVTELSLVVKDDRIERMHMNVRNNRSAASSSTVSAHLIKSLSLLLSGAVLALGPDVDEVSFSHLGLEVIVSDGVGFRGSLSQRGEWIYADVNQQTIEVPAVKDAFIGTDAFAERWRMLRDYNRNGWPDERGPEPPASGGRTVGEALRELVESLTTASQPAR